MCETNPCKNDGECEVDLHMKNRFRCKCEPDWTGTLCENENSDYKGEEISSAK